MAWPGFFGRVEGADIVFAAIDEVVGELAVEVLQRVGREGESGVAARRPRQRAARASRSSMISSSSVR